LRLAYERFFSDYTDAPVLAIDTDDLNWVSDPEALALVVGRVRMALEDGFEQPQLPMFESTTPDGVERVADEELVAKPRRRLADFQRWQQARDRDGAELGDLYLNYMGLTQEVGELGSEMTVIWRQQKALYQKLGNQPEALEQAMTECLPHLRQELADCLASLLKLANNAGIDLEAAYLDKVKR
jgi:NTP pyrophosphatase (non-canonical NTP hydrolase)